LIERFLSFGIAACLVACSKVFNIDNMCRVDKDADGRIAEEEVLEVSDQMNILIVYYWLFFKIY
jgi:hypothetical protein